MPEAKENTPAEHLYLSHSPSPMSAFTTLNAIPPSSSESGLRERRQSLRERCGFTEFISFSPAFPNIPAKGHLGPTAGNLPRRKRSSAASLPLPALAPAPVFERGEFFGA
ncbi:hypothetical protein DFH06DRAFT_1317451 [Mycena polygramma]|nr:hypothetical protein DFH06DRAFT_1317451 [Mycena polygramma]